MCFYYHHHADNVMVAAFVDDAQVVALFIVSNLTFAASGLLLFHVAGETMRIKMQFYFIKKKILPRRIKVIIFHTRISAQHVIELFSI
jgi:hypothetical protein